MSWPSKPPPLFLPFCWKMNSVRNTLNLTVQIVSTAEGLVKVYALFTLEIAFSWNSACVYLLTAVTRKRFLSMHSTKDNILAYLKRSGGAGVDAVASEFGPARMTVRQHLSALERDRLVLSREEGGRTGRSRLLFTFVGDGEVRF